MISAGIIIAPASEKKKNPADRVPARLGRTGRNPEGEIHRQLGGNLLAEHYELCELFPGFHSRPEVVQAVVKIKLDESVYSGWFRQF